MNGESFELSFPELIKSEVENAKALNMKFPKGRYDPDSIEKSWVADMMDFSKNFLTPNGRFDTEQFLLYKIDEDHYLQGYIDLVKYEKDGSVSIYDWKTSSEYVGDALTHGGRQLIMYGMALQQQGYKIKNLAWVFLKYAQIDFVGFPRSNSKTKKAITKISKRGAIVKTLLPFIQSELRYLKYDDIEIEYYKKQLYADNTLDCLPDEVKNMFDIKPYVLRYDFTLERQQETLEYMNKMIQLFETKGDNEAEWPAKDFYKYSKAGKKSQDTFFCTFLCNHKKTCKFIKEHVALYQLNKKKDEDLF